VKNSTAFQKLEVLVTTAAGILRQSAINQNMSNLRFFDDFNQQHRDTRTQVVLAVLRPNAFPSGTTSWSNQCRFLQRLIVRDLAPAGKTNCEENRVSPGDYSGQWEANRQLQHDFKSARAYCDFMDAKCYGDDHALDFDELISLGIK
jgi:hypothetical protein